MKKHIFGIIVGIAIAAASIALMNLLASIGKDPPGIVLLFAHFDAFVLTATYWATGTGRASKESLPRPRLRGLLFGFSFATLLAIASVRLFGL